MPSVLYSPDLSRLTSETGSTVAKALQWGEGRLSQVARLTIWTTRHLELSVIDLSHAELVHCNVGIARTRNIR